MQNENKQNTKVKTYFVGYEDNDDEFFKIRGSEAELAAKIIDIFGEDLDELSGLEVYEAGNSKRVKIQLKIKLT